MRSCFACFGDLCLYSGNQATDTTVFCSCRYCIRACLFVMNYELPEYVQACPGGAFTIL